MSDLYLLMESFGNLPFRTLGMVECIHPQGMVECIHPLFFYQMQLLKPAPCPSCFRYFGFQGDPKGWNFQFYR